jgi:hypothetical protein
VKVVRDRFESKEGGGGSEGEERDGEESLSGIITGGVEEGG